MTGLPRTEPTWEALLAPPARGRSPRHPGRGWPRRSAVPRQQPPNEGSRRDAPTARPWPHHAPSHDDPIERIYHPCPSRQPMAAHAAPLVAQRYPKGQDHPRPTTLSSTRSTAAPALLSAKAIRGRTPKSRVESSSLAGGTTRFRRSEALPSSQPQTSRRRRRSHPTAAGVAATTRVVRHPSGSGRQQPVHETRVPFDVVLE
jgi:hypothetical protein